MICYKSVLLWEFYNDKFVYMLALKLYYTEDDQIISAKTFVIIVFNIIIIKHNNL